ncbi:MAG: hypothetical protein RDU01_11775 [Thermodesulfovibrionales bacterium]|nr:hypothetical protein [Thermodesulfovibrionales bacterium]
MKKSSVAVFLGLSVLALYALSALYIPLLGSYFFADDTQAIWFAASKSAGQIFFDPDNYRGLSGSNFTPMVGVTFKIDWLLFKLDPWGYTVHSLIAVLLAGTGLFLFLRLYTDTLTSFTAFVMYLLNPLVLSVYGWCSSRHYIEGLFFALLALYFHGKADRKGNISFLSGILYLVASLYKEVYVILPALAFLITQGTAIQKVKRTLPMWGCLLVYSIWRFRMLGGIGGYPFGDALNLQTAAAGVYRLAEFLPRHLFGAYSLLFWGIVLIMLLTLSRKKVLFVVIVFPVLLIPIVQVTGLIDSSYAWARYMLHITIFMICMASLWLGEVAKKSIWIRVPAYLLMVAVMGVFVMKGYQVKNTILNERAISLSTAREFMYSDAPYIHAKEVPWFYDGLLVLNKYFFQREIKTMIIPEPRYQKYLSDERMRDILSNGYRLDNPPDGSLRKEFISGQVHTRKYLVTWDLGPRQEGVYLILRGRHEGMYDFVHHVPRNGLHHFGKYYPDDRHEVFYLRVVYQSPEGWEAISDEYRFTVPGNATITLNHK